MHFYDFNIGEYAKKTQHLTNEEDLAYRRALDMYYDTEKPLPTDGLATLSRRLRVDQQALKNVIEEFFPNGINKHAEEKIAAYYSYIEKQKANGKLGGRPKRTQAKPIDNPALTQTKPSAKPTLTTNQEPLTINQEQDIQPSSPPKAPPCKTQEIIDLFAKQCPSMIQPRLVADSVKAMIADRWRQSPKHQTLDFWRDYFDYCESLDFLTGRASPSRGEKSFRVGLEWIVKSANFAKIINGNYANG